MLEAQTVALSFVASKEAAALATRLEAAGLRVVDFSLSGHSQPDQVPDAIVCDSASRPELVSAILEAKTADPGFVPALVVLGRDESAQSWLAAGFDYFLRRPLNLDMAETLLKALLGVRSRSLRWAEETAAHFRTLFDATGTATIVVEADQTIAMANKECQRVTGYSEEELVGTKWTDYVAPESLALMLAYHKARREGPPAAELALSPSQPGPPTSQISPLEPSPGHPWPPEQYETRLINKAGEVRDVMLHVCLTPTGGRSVVSMLDITDYRRATAELEARERLFRDLFDHHSAVKLLIDPRDLRIVDANHAAAAFYGWSREQLVGMNMDDINVSPAETVRAARQAMLQGSRRGFELIHRKADGSECTVEVYGSPIENRGQTLLYAIIHDISERKQAETEKLELERQLAQSLKMEAIGRLAGGIAHDLNNMLTTMLGCSELILADEDACSHAARRDVETIREAAHRAASLTSQILAFARQQPLRPQVFSLDEVLRRMDPLLRRLLGEDIQVLITPAAGATLVEADPHQVEQVIMNLVVNARDAMPRGGRLVLGTSEVKLSEEYCQAHPEAAPGDYVLLAVSDTGHGMDEYTRSRIFEPFFTTKPAGQGTGLGLSTVYGIVKQSGGCITVYSEPGLGTTFKVYLPQARPEKVAAIREAHPERDAVLVAEAGESRPAVAARLAETVLVVEDDPALRSLVVRVLTGAGYNVLTAASADEALTFSARPGPLPRLLLTDVVLPGGLRGDELAARLEFVWPGLAVIYMSGYARDHLTFAGRLAHDVEYLQKPFAPEALLTTVRRVLDEHAGPV